MPVGLVVAKGIVRKRAWSLFGVVLTELLHPDLIHTRPSTQAPRAPDRPVHLTPDCLLAIRSDCLTDFGSSGQRSARSSSVSSELTARSRALPAEAPRDAVARGQRAGRERSLHGRSSPPPRAISTGRSSPRSTAARPTHPHTGAARSASRAPTPERSPRRRSPPGRSSSDPLDDRYGRMMACAHCRDDHRPSTSWPERLASHSCGRTPERPTASAARCSLHHGSMRKLSP